MILRGSDQPVEVRVRSWGGSTYRGRPVGHRRRQRIGWTCQPGEPILFRSAKLTASADWRRRAAAGWRSLVRAVGPWVDRTRDGTGPDPKRIAPLWLAPVPVRRCPHPTVHVAFASHRPARSAAARKCRKKLKPVLRGERPQSQPPWMGKLEWKTLKSLSIIHFLSIGFQRSGLFIISLSSLFYVLEHFINWSNTNIGSGWEMFYLGVGRRMGRRCGAGRG